jgi:hypothetical protein
MMEPFFTIRHTVSYSRVELISMNPIINASSTSLDHAFIVEPDNTKDVQNEFKPPVPPRPDAPRALPHLNALIIGRLSRSFKSSEAINKVHIRSGAQESAGSKLEKKSSWQPPLESFTYFNPVPPKRQTRMADCWYSAITMVLRGKHGEGYKAVGDTIKSSRGPLLIGKRLSFGSPEGQRIMADNGLVEVGYKLEIGSSDSVANLLRKHGPFIVVGTYDATNLGHTVVIVGVDHASQSVCVQDPAQSNASAQWFPLDYLRHTYRTPGSDNIAMDAVIALDPSR